MRKKIIIIMAMVLCMSLGMTAAAFAETESVAINDGNTTVASGAQYIIQSVNARQVEPFIYVSGNKLKASVIIKVKDSAYKVSGNLYLEEKSGKRWIKARTWEIDQTGDVNITKSVNYTSGHTYRVRVDVSINGENINKVTDPLEV